MSGFVGRPAKYDRVVQLLDSHTLYCGASIVMFADRLGLCPGDNDQQHRLNKLRMRVALNRRVAYHLFPPEGDGQLRLKGNAPICAWFGWRWKESYGITHNRYR